MSGISWSRQRQIRRASNSTVMAFCQSFWDSPLGRLVSRPLNCLGVMMGVASENLGYSKKGGLHGCGQSGLSHAFTFTRCLYLIYALRSGESGAIITTY